MIGQSPAFLDAIKNIGKIADSDIPVLIEGETGTGKEVVAREIHYRGWRRSRPFIPVNCGAIPDPLIENELFGHERGAFTDARERHQGLLSLAGEGTLFLDEVDTLSPKGQVTLLRVLQDKKFRPLGSIHERHANARIIAATNASLARLMKAGQFRPDLFYRLAILLVQLPPLRERRGDVSLFAEHFLMNCNRSHGPPEKCFHKDTLRRLANHSWPGNIRELESFVSRAFFLTDESEILADPLTDGPTLIGTIGQSRIPPESEQNFSDAKAKAVADFEKRYLHAAMERAEGNVTRAAQSAGKDRRSFGRLLKKHGINPRSFQPNSK